MTPLSYLLFLPSKYLASEIRLDQTCSGWYGHRLTYSFSIALLTHYSTAFSAFCYIFIHMKCISMLFTLSFSSLLPPPHNPLRQTHYYNYVLSLSLSPSLSTIYTYIIYMYMYIWSYMYLCIYLSLRCSFYIWGKTWLTCLIWWSPVPSIYL
jgi:hypothetical protein